MKQRSRAKRASQPTSSGFADFYEQQRSVVLRSVISKIGPLHEAEDLTQAVFVKALAAWQRCPYPFDQRTPWLLRIARNVVIDYRRSAARAQSVSLSNTLEVIGPADPFKEAEAAAIRLSYAQALARLTDRQRQVATRFFEGFSLRDVARELGLSEGAIKSTVYRVKRVLRRDPVLARWVV
jgi:RNA polymerase sigma-70 factor (ECF subfamily)